jgi:hypothetical protein
MNRIAYLIAAAAFCGSSPASAQRVDGGASSNAVLTTSAELSAAVDRIAARSALWRDAMKSLSDLGRQALLLTPDQVVVRESPAARTTDAFDATTLAEVSPVVSPDASIDVVMVVVNVDLLSSMHRRLGSSRADFEADLERVLIHEVYGHAVPYLLAGSASGRCADPARGQPAMDACSVQRENAVRAEAGLGERTDYTFGGLVLMDRLRRNSALAHGKGPRKNKVTEFAPRFGSDWVDLSEQNRRRSRLVSRPLPNDRPGACRLAGNICPHRREPSSLRCR